MNNKQMILHAATAQGAVESYNRFKSLLRRADKCYANKCKGTGACGVKGRLVQV